jgi:hypothetical protein
MPGKGVDIRNSTFLHNAHQHSVRLYHEPGGVIVVESASIPSAATVSAESRKALPSGRGIG